MCAGHPRSGYYLGAVALGHDSARLQCDNMLIYLPYSRAPHADQWVECCAENAGACILCARAVRRVLRHVQAKGAHVQGGSFSAPKSNDAILHIKAAVLCADAANRGTKSNLSTVQHSSLTVTMHPAGPQGLHMHTSIVLKKDQPFTRSILNKAYNMCPLSSFV